jgi:hypothetical protein
MDDRDIGKVAQAMISVFHATTTVEIKKRAAEALDNGDEAAFRAWCAILDSVRFLQTSEAAE